MTPEERIAKLEELVRLLSAPSYSRDENAIYRLKRELGFF